MTSSSGTNGDPQLTSMRGYPRAAVEEFLAGATAERSRLERRIDDARTREARAKASLEAPGEQHHALVSMVIDAQRELNERRRRVEPGVLAILDRAAQEAQAIRSSARADAESLLAGSAPPEQAAPAARLAPPPLAGPGAHPGSAGHDRVVDLTSVTRLDPGDGSGVQPPGLHSGVR